MFSSIGKPNLRKSQLENPIIEEKSRRKSEKKKLTFCFIIQLKSSYLLGKDTKTLSGFKIWAEMREP